MKHIQFYLHAVNGRIKRQINGSLVEKEDIVNINAKRDEKDKS